jgi:DNA-binding NarL/FixJ family response regulator
MVAIAIVSADPILRRCLTQLLRGEPTVTAVSVADDPAAVLPLVDQNRVDAILTDALSREQLKDWRGKLAVIALLDGPDDPETSFDALHAGAWAILPRSAGREEIVAAIKAVVSGLAVLPHELLPTLLDGASLADELVNGKDGGHAQLTTRELEVLTAMADGASNKAIARRLGISVHTAKFHVAAILAKLNADNRTEAVTRAAQLGLVML